MLRMLSCPQSGNRSAGILTVLALGMIVGCSGEPAPQPTASEVEVQTQADEPDSAASTSSPEHDSEEIVESIDEDIEQEDSRDEPDTELEGPTAAPVLPVVEAAIDEEIELTTGFVVSLSSITLSAVEAETPGDVAGDVVEVIVEVTNNSRESQSINSAVVSLETTDGDLGIPTIAGGAEPLYGDISPMESMEGQYKFMLDPVNNRNVIIRVNYAAGEPIAQFTGVTP